MHVGNNWLSPKCIIDLLVSRALVTAIGLAITAAAATTSASPSTTSIVAAVVTSSTAKKRMVTTTKARGRTTKHQAHSKAQLMAKRRKSLETKVMHRCYLGGTLILLLIGITAW